MKFRLLLFTTALFLFTGCWTARIVSYSPSGISATYSVVPTTPVSTVVTTVTAPKTLATTTTARVTPVSQDISLCLDLQAVGAAFAQANTVEEFERLLNDSSYMLSNLDLNHDGYVDYLRVLETVQGIAHVFVIQAVLAENVYQDVATLVAEVTGTYTTSTVQIIGAPYIYGPQYIVQPVYVAAPLIFAHLVRPYYAPWHSPWCWGHYPPHYKHPCPIYMSHYHAYIDTFMHNHHYCHGFNYVTVCHYPDYNRVCAPVCRNDYAVQHPETEFSRRTADIPVQNSSSRPKNARDIRESASASRTTVTSSSSRPASAPAATSATSSRPASASAASTTMSRPASTAAASSSSSRPASTATATGSRSSSSSRSSSVGQTVKSSVSSSGSANTRISTVTSSGSRSTATRSSSASSSSSRSVSSSPAASSRPSSGASRPSSGSSASSRTSSTSRR